MPDNNLYKRDRTNLAKINKNLMLLIILLTLLTKRALFGVECFSTVFLALLLHCCYYSKANNNRHIWLL